MKVRLQIFSAAVIAIFILLQAQPLLLDMSNISARTKMAGNSQKGSCSKGQKPTCARSKCSVPKEDDNTDNSCRDIAGCNPFVPCSIGFCCYLVEGFITYNIVYTGTKQKLSCFNDNRISSALSECWHPPEIVS